MKLTKKMFAGFRRPPVPSKLNATYHGTTAHTAACSGEGSSSRSSSSSEGGSSDPGRPPPPQPPPRRRRSTPESLPRPRRIPSLSEGAPEEGEEESPSALSEAASFLPPPGHRGREPRGPAPAPPTAVRRASDPAPGASFNDFLAFVSDDAEPKASPAAASESAGCPHDAKSNRLSRNADAARPTGGCPFKHGTVYAGPYPGYVHGNPNRGICPAGCRPKLNDKVTLYEDAQDTLLREALEYCELYYHERAESMKGAASLKGTNFVSKEERMEQIRSSIEQTGTYEHTFDELQHGARVAWRNAPKCSNRKYWGQLKLLDCRDVATNRGMYEACIRHLEKAMSCGSSEAYVTVFKPAPPGGEKDGPRLWNDQLLQFAAYGDDGKVIGDPKNLRFTEMLKQRFGWDGPPDGKRGPYDYLPLVIQADPDEPPELFEVPLECAPPVFIHHPQYPELSSLGMRWYPIPAVCALDMTVGGICYTAVPFNGWYASTEVLRDLTDNSRYNMLAPVAKALGMDPDTKPGDAPLWIDDVMAILSKAVYHSFKVAKIAMVDHHTLINMFHEWYNDEMKHRSYCPVNWKWVIPPMSSSTSSAYLGLSKAQEYTLKPAYIIGKGFLQLETSHFGSRDRSKAVNDFFNAVYLAIFFKRMISRFRGRKEPVLIIYASVTGNAAKWASDLGSVLRTGCNVSFFDACGVNAARDTDILGTIESSKLTIFVSSTQGNGELPSLANKFFSFLFDENSHLLAGKRTACLGFGSSAYPIFCGAIDILSKMLSKCKAKELIPRGKCDAVKGEASVFYAWAEDLVQGLANLPSASPFTIRMAETMKESSAASVLLERRTIVDSVNVEVFSPDEVESAAAMSFMTRRRTMRRRSSIESQESIVEETPRAQLLQKIISRTGSDHTNHFSEKNIFVGHVKGREDLISSAVPEGESETVTRKTSLVKIDLSNCGDPPYQPGDHIQVVPRNVIGADELETFVSHLSGGVSIDSYIYATLENDISRSELVVSFPLLESCLGNIVPLDYFLERQCALLAPISMQACLELSDHATGKDEAILKGLGQDANEHEKMTSLTGLKWINVFKTFPSLSGQVSVSVLLCSMKVNHLRSYSIASCKAVVGSELHIAVGRLIYSRGGSKKEAGICSSYLTSVEPGQSIMFKLESAPSFHLPIDPSCPIVFICTGTGFAPIRGLLQKRMYLQSRGEKLGPAVLVFGQRSSSEGLFDDEINTFVDKGALAATFAAYSREPGMAKEYVTDKLQTNRIGWLLSPTLQKPNAHVFICGSANMAEESKSVLRQISTKECIDKMIADGRLHCDVFGALSTTKRFERVASAGNVMEALMLDDVSDLVPDSEHSDVDASARSLNRSKRAAMMALGKSRSDWMLLGDAGASPSFLEELLVCDSDELLDRSLYKGQQKETFHFATGNE